MAFDRPTETGCTWPSYLRSRDPHELLARFLDSDPLRLCEASAQRLRQTWFLVDPDRLFLRSAAVVADAVGHEDPPASMPGWIRQKIDLAIEQLVLRDKEAELAHPDDLDEEETEFSLLTESLMLEPEFVRHASVRFNSLNVDSRRAFFELLIEGRTLEELLQGELWDPDSLYTAVHQALDTLGLGLSSEKASETLRSRLATGRFVVRRCASAVERHLLEARNDVLARHLLRAATLAYWSDPQLSHVPRTNEGKPVDLGTEVEQWRCSAQSWTRPPYATEANELLAVAMGTLPRSMAATLTRASLNLSPRSASRYWLALSLWPDESTTAIRMLEELAACRHSQDYHYHVLDSLAARLARSGRFECARDAYSRATAIKPEGPIPYFYLFNLSCLLGDAESACEHAEQIGHLVKDGDPRVAEARRLLRKWKCTRPDNELRGAHVVDRLASHRFPPPARSLLSALLT